MGKDLGHVYWITRKERYQGDTMATTELRAQVKDRVGGKLVSYQ